jgi:putative ABC transport system permease protein
VETLRHDIRYGIRSLARMRGSAALAITALALGIGATTTLFSVVDATLWRPLPLDRADRLAVLYTTRTTARDGLVRLRWSIPAVNALQRSATSFEAMASFSLTSIAIGTADGLPEQIDGEIIAPDYFRVLHVAPASGRTFTASEDTTPSGHPVALISDALARRRYANANAVGGIIHVNDVALTILGVMPPGFRGLSGKADVWLPRMMAPLLTYSEYLTTPQHFVMAVARLKDGIGLETANAELAAIGARLGDEPSPEPATWGAVARRLGDARVDVVARRSAYALLGSAGCVLLIACVNVASLLLARARTRQREIAVRLAIGSSRWRIVRQLLTEGLLIAAAAGTAGVVLAYWGSAFFARSSPAVIASGRNDYAQLAAFAAPMVNLRVLAFALATAVGTTLLFALAPALAAVRPDLVPALKEQDRAAGSRAFGGLVIVEVALAVLLLVSAGVLLESFQQMQNRRAGFDPDRVLTFWIRPANSKYRVADGPAIVQRLLTSIQQAPGVAAAAVNRATPFYGGSRTTAFFPGRPADRLNAPVVGRHYISEDYFRVLGIPLIAGRMLTSADRAGTQPVTVVNETAARRFWPGDNPIGQRVWFGTTTGPFSDPQHAVEVVGLVGDVKYADPDQPQMADFYTSFLQFCFPDTVVVAKTTAGATDAVPAIRAAVAAVDPALPIYDILTLDDRIDGVLARPRFNAAVVGAFALAALALAALGVYGILSYSVSSRRHELGVRLALGADARRLIRLILREGLTLAAIGVTIGLAASAAAGLFLRGLLVGVSPTNPRLLTIGAVIMLAVAALAAALPARRAAHVDPMIVLRE